MPNCKTQFRFWRNLTEQAKLCEERTGKSPTYFLWYTHAANSYAFNWSPWACI